MERDDLEELERLSSLLAEIGAEVASADQTRALKMAALALQAAFMNGQRGTLEREFNALGDPLTDSQLEHLRALGVEPDAPTA